MSDLNLEGQLRLLAARCVRRVARLMTDPLSISALDVAERHAKGEATDEELAAAWDAADAAWDAAWAAELAEQQKILDKIKEVKPCV